MRHNCTINVLHTRILMNNLNTVDVILCFDMETITSKQEDVDKEKKTIVTTKVKTSITSSPVFVDVFESNIFDENISKKLKSGSRSKLRRKSSLTSLSLHLKRQSTFSWTKFQEQTEEQKSKLNTAIECLFILFCFILVFIFYSLPNIAMNPSNTVGILLQNTILLTGVDTFPFYVMRSNFEIETSTDFYKGLLFTNITVTIITCLYEMILLMHNIHPLPFRALWISVIWFITNPLLCYLTAFKIIRIEVKKYLYSMIMVVYVTFYFYTGIVFVIGYNACKFIKSCMFIFLFMHINSLVYTQYIYK